MDYLGGAAIMQQNNNIPVFISFSMLKGGVGKTDLAYNYMMWLASQKSHKVLGIDLDENCNFSQVLNVYDQQDTVANILSGEGDVKLHHINENVDLIAGYNRLGQLQEDLATSEKKTMMLYMWLEDNFERYNIGQYDFIIIDTHNDLGTATKNAVAVSDVIFSPIVPNEFSDSISMEVKLDEFRDDVIDFRTRESYITADLKLIGNMIRHNTKNSHQFLEHMKGNDDYIAKFQFREIFNTSIQTKTPICDLLSEPKSQGEKNFKKDFNDNMEQLYKVSQQYQ